MPSPITVPIFQNKPMAGLPSQAADVAELQRKSALASALMGQAMSPIQGQPVGSGPYQIVPKTGLATGISQLGSALLARNLNKQISEGNRSLSDAYAAQLRSMFGGGSSGVSTPAPASQAPQATVSPQGPYAGGLNQPPPQETQQAAPQSAPQAATTSPMNPAGLDPSMAGMLYMQDPAKYAEQFVAPYYKPADIFGKIRAAGMDPNSPLGHQIAQMNLAKENYVAPIGGARQGTVAFDPITHQPLFAQPDLGRNANLTYDQNGQLSVTPIPGAAGAAAQLTGAETAARETNTPRLVPTPSGGSAFGYPGQFAGPPPAFGGNPNAPANPPPSGAPAPQPQQPGEAPVWKSVPKMVIPSGVGAPGAYSEAIQKGSAEKAMTLREQYGKEADLADQKVALNREAMKVLSQAEVGPLSDKLTKWRGILKELGVPDGLISGEKVEATQELKKYLVNNAIQGARQLYGARMTQQEVAMQKEEANPSDAMTEKAIRELVRFQNLQNEYSKKRAQDFDTYLSKGGDPLRFESWYTSKFPLSGFVQQPTREEILAEMKRRGISP